MKMIKKEETKDYTKLKKKGFKQYYTLLPDVSLTLNIMTAFNAKQ